MNKDVYDTWQKLAGLKIKDEIDALRIVLDPNDRRGVKNSYLDRYFKYYLLEHLAPRPEDSILEIGCGIGRLTEFISRFAGSVYGIDLMDQFIDTCRTRPSKNKNTFYLHMHEKEKLREFPITKLYTVGVLMFLINNDELVKTLQDYLRLLPHLKSAFFIEQVKTDSALAKGKNEVFCRYRTLQEYIQVFEAAGFRVKHYVIMGERHNGYAYRVLHYTANLLPRWCARFADTLFRLDKYLLRNATRTKFIRNRRPTDILFHLEPRQREYFR